MIQGEVLQELIPNRRYKVRIMNNKPLKDDIRKTLEEEAAKVQEALDEIQKKYDDYNETNNVARLEVEIEKLEQHEEQTLSVLNKINRIERQIFNIIVVRSEMERAFRSVAQELRNVQVQLIRLNNEPDYFDFDVWCSNYRKWNVGDTVPLVSNGYDVKDWVILPDWEFNKEDAGFGNALTSKYLLETYEWVYSQIKLNENINKDVTKYGKAKVIYREGDKVSIQVEWARIWDMGTVSRQRVQEVYTNCNTIYTEGAYIPYFIGSEVLVRFRSDWEADVIGFWQEPVKPFNISANKIYEKDLMIENLIDREQKGLSSQDNFGLSIRTLSNGNEVVRYTLERSFPNLRIKPSNETNFKIAFIGMFDNFIAVENFHQSNLQLGKIFNFFNKHGRSYNHNFLPFAFNLSDLPSGFHGDTSVINDGQIKDGYIKTKISSGYDKPLLRFHSNQLSWNNCIIDINNSYKCTVRSGVAYTPPCYNLITVERADGTSEVKSFDDVEVQGLLQSFLDNRDILYQANKENLEPLFNPRTGLTFDDYYSFFYDCLSSTGFYTQEIVDSFISDSLINLEDLLGSFDLNDVDNPNAFATTYYFSGSPIYRKVDGSFSSLPILDVSDNNEAVNLFRNFKKPKHTDVIKDTILKNGLALGQSKDWYINSVTKQEFFNDSSNYAKSDYNKYLSFNYYEISYIE